MLSVAFIRSAAVSWDPVTLRPQCPWGCAVEEEARAELGSLGGETRCTDITR